MPDETESAVAAWLDSPTTKREITIARRQLARGLGDPNHAWLLVLLVEILDNLNIYRDRDPDHDHDEFPDKGADEPWRTP